MNRYKSYQEAKIANPESEIWVNTNGNFGLRDVIAETIYTMHKCIASDYCMSADEFRGRGHAFVDGDLVVNINDMVQSVKADFLNTVDSPLNLCTFVLRAAALENQMNIDNLATQTPEEKEALDLIDTAPHQYEMSKFSGNEWKNGDECLYLNERECVFIGMRMNSKTHCIVETKSNSTYMPVNVEELSKPESTQQREERERAHAIYDMCASVDNFTEESNFWAGKFYDAKYRKESN